MGLVVQGGGGYLVVHQGGVPHLCTTSLYTPVVGGACGPLYLLVYLVYQVWSGVHCAIVSGLTEGQVH